MQLLFWLSARMTGRPQTLSTPQRKPTVRFQPQLESLQGRDLPSVLTVTNNLDSGAGSLRAEIAAAQTGDTINFAPSMDGQTIKLTSGQLVINKSVTIQGPGAGQLAISGNNTLRVLDVNGATNPNVTLTGLTITEGNAGSGNGGGIYSSYGSTLTISGCTLSNNRAFDGGGIYNYASNLQIVNGNLSGNKASDPNGCGKGGAVYSVGFTHAVSMIGCTFLNNSATDQGGAIWIISTMMTINDCSFSGNFSGYSGGAGPIVTGNDIYNAASASMLTVSDSVFSNNTPYHFDPIAGPWTNGGGNIFN